MSKKTRKNAKGVIRNPINRKNYSYELNGVSLSFVLRQDTKSELESFLELLEAAIFDVKEDTNHI